MAMRALLRAVVVWACLPARAQAQPHLPGELPVSDNGAQLCVRRDTGCTTVPHWLGAEDPPSYSTCQLSIRLIEVFAAVVRRTAVLGTERCQDVSTRLHQREIFTGESGLLGLRVALALSGYH